MNWRVRIYRGSTEAHTWVIENRTEHEAEREALADTRMKEFEKYHDFDWTMTKIEDK